MVKFVESNADLPRLLSTEAKQIARAKSLASTHLGIKAKRAEGIRFQGFFSRTMKVTMADGTVVIIQFRVEPLDLNCFKQARQSLGNVVPEIERLDDPELEQEEVEVFLMTCVPGKTWLESYKRDRWDPKMNVIAMTSMGEILSRGCVQSDSAEVVETKIKPKLEALRSSPYKVVQKFHADVIRLQEKADQLKALPLWISHADLNHVNILVQPSGDVSGIVDWELSEALPFGVGLSRIHDLAGRFRDRKFYQPEEFEEAERAFWKSFYEGVSSPIREILDKHAEAVQSAICIGTLLSTFESEEGHFNQAGVGTLPLLLKYRIPALRGATEPPFTVA